MCSDVTALNDFLLKFMCFTLSFITSYVRAVIVLQLGVDVGANPTSYTQLKIFHTSFPDWTPYEPGGFAGGLPVTHRVLLYTYDLKIHTWELSASVRNLSACKGLI